tara:strand:+ start:1019 stop:1243 length:225 start_codon:yes stop_codon:yes gene_type:complete
MNKEKNFSNKVDKDLQAVKFISMKGKTMQELREVKTLHGCDCYENQGKPNMFSRVVHNESCYTTELKLVDIIVL